MFPFSANGQGEPAIEARAVSRLFDTTVVLDRVSMEVRRGHIHALLGPNGAGKTTLLRILAGLTAPTTGTVRLMGHNPERSGGSFKSLIGYLPAGDRSFYLRLSALENLVFFGRLQGLGYRSAAARAREVLDLVGLTAPARLSVGKYSHGMQKRLAVARALLVDPPVLLIDEATHDLDPDGGRQVRDLITAAAARGASVVWATQRIDEIRGFATAVTLLHRGQVRFSGTVPELSAHSIATRYVLRLRRRSPDGHKETAALEAAVARYGLITRDGGEDVEICMLSLADNVVLGDALAAIAAEGFTIVTCHEERSEIEQAFLHLTKEAAP